MAPRAQARLYKPDPKDEADVRSAFVELDRQGGIALTADESKAYLQWLETGEGPCPVKGG